MDTKANKKKVQINNLVVKYSEFNEEMLDDAVNQAALSLSLLEKGEYKNYWEVAQFMKKYFDKTYGGAWHVIVGESFGSFVTNEVNRLTYFFLTNVAFLVYQHG